MQYAPLGRSVKNIRHSTVRVVSGRKINLVCV